jgi:twitching motility two-component system response regulator PilG
MTTTINVGIIGFSAFEEKKIKKIFEFSCQNERAYKLSNIADIEPVDLLLAKKGDELAAQQVQTYLARYKSRFIPVVTSGKEKPSNTDIHYIRGVLVPSRVFVVLDKVQISSVTPESELEVQESFTEQNQSQQFESIAETLTEQSEDALHVLVVDDSVMMQKTIKLELEKATVPLAVDFADTGEIALEKVKLKKYDFILLDVMMPGIDGFETCTQMRKLEGMAKTPIIMLTAKTSALDEVKGLMAGCTTYLTKPFEHEEFHKMLERIMHWVKEFNESK